MTDTSASSESGSVLRPFEQRPMEPLPPVEPSKVVPVDRMPRVPDSITPEDVTEADNEPPVENEVGILEELEESFEQIEGAADGDETTAEASDHASDGFWGPAGRDDDGDDDGFDIDVLLGPRPDQGVAERSELEETDDVLAEAGEGHGPTPDGDEGEVAAADPAGRDAGRTVELPRKPFLVASGIIGVLLVVLVALWQTSEGGSGDEATGSTQPGPSPVDSAPDQPDAEQPATDPATDPSGPEDVARLRSEITGLNAEVSGLNAQVDTLQGRIDSQPPPALPGDALLRVPVASGSKFISAEGQSIAVVSPFGGYANIEAGTNVVNASGKVADGGTRVLRTATSVWITNYADGQLIRVDPLANTVAGVFPFPAPDGLAKYGDALLVASYDGGFLGGVDPSDGEIVEQVALGGSPTDVLVTDDAIWVTLFDTGELVRIDAGDFFVTNRLVVGAGPVGLWSTTEGLWVVNHEEGTVVLVDPLALEVIETIEVGEGPTDALGAFGRLWVTVTDAGDLVEIDPATGDIVSRTPLGGPGLGGGPVGIEHAAGSLWIAMDRENSVVRVTPPS